MTRLIFLIIPLIICCSSNHQHEDKILSDFHYPFDSLKIPRVFVYQRTDSINILSYNLQQLIEKDNYKILVSTTLSDDKTRDSLVFELINNEPIIKEEYMIYKDSKTNSIKTLRGEILENIDNGKTRKAKVKFKDESFITIISTLKSENDSTFIYNIFNKEITCARTDDNQTISIIFRKLPIIRKKREQNGEFIYAQNLGLVFYTVNDRKTNQTYSFKLTEIIDYKDFIKK
jgi:hypothetical protein